MNDMGWIYIIGFLISLSLLRFILWMEKRDLEAEKVARIRQIQKERAMELFKRVDVPAGTMIPIQGTGKSILFEEMKEMHKNRELKDLNEEEDIIEKLLREARSRE